MRIDFFVFMQQIHYYARRRATRIELRQPPLCEHKESQTVANKTVHAHIQNSNEVFYADLEVPAIPPSEFSPNNIINVTYHVCVRNSLL